MDVGRGNDMAMPSEEPDLCMGVLSSDEEDAVPPTQPDNVGSGAVIVEIEDEAEHSMNPATTDTSFAGELAMGTPFNVAVLQFRERTSTILTSLMDEDSQQVFPDDMSQGGDGGNDGCVAIASDSEMEDVSDLLEKVSLRGSYAGTSRPCDHDESQQDNVSSCPSPPAQFEDSFFA